MNNFFKNSAILTIYSFIAIPLGYFLRLLYANNLSLKEFGLFYAVINLFGIIAIFNDLGFSETQAYFIPKYLVRGELEKVKSTIVACLINQVVSTAIILIIFLLFSQIVSLFLFKSTEAYLLLKYMAISFVLSDFLANISVLFYSYKEVNIYGSIESTRLFFTLTLLTIFLPIFKQNTLITIATTWIVTYLILTAYYTWLFFHRHKNLVVVKMFSLRKTYKTLILFAFPTALRSGANIILSSSAVLLLTVIKGVESVALYNIAQPIASVLLLFISPISNLLSPITTEMDTINNQTVLQRLLSHILNFGSFLLLPCISILVIYSYEIIQSLFGIKYVEASVILKLFSGSMFFIIMNEFIYGFITGLGLPKDKMKIMYIASALNLIVCLMLIPFWGVLGAVLASIVSQVFLFFMGLYILHCRSIFSRKQLKKYELIVINLIIFILCQYVFIHYLNIQNIYLRIVFNSLMSGGIYIFLGLKVFKIVNLQSILSKVRSSGKH